MKLQDLPHKTKQASVTTDLTLIKQWHISRILGEGALQNGLQMYSNCAKPNGKIMVQEW